MSGSLEFISTHGSKSFEEFPFCDADAVLFCEISYAPIEKAVSESFDNPLSFVETDDILVRLRNGKDKRLGLMITNAPVKKFSLMAKQERYQKIQVLASKAVYSIKPAVQFGATAFILPDGTICLCYRGTDDTVAGWKEDLDLFFHKGTPSYKLAVDYIEELAEKTEGDIIICGHSKGGNVALYAALMCSDKVRKRIKKLYNYDGPGFYNDKFFDSEEYSRIKPVYRHCIPSDSLVGVLLYHDNDYSAVKSRRLLGAFQHDVGTWQIEDGRLVEVAGNDTLSKTVDEFLRGLCGKTTEKCIDACNIVFDALVAGLGNETLTLVAKHAGKALKGGINAWKGIEPEIRETFSSTFKGSLQLLKDSYNKVKSLTT